jgi:head-tail adaptor
MKTATNELRERITFLTYDLKDDDTGGVSQEFKEDKTVWARIIPLRSKVSSHHLWHFTLLSGSPVKRGFYEVTIRFREMLSSTTRIRWNGHIFLILTDPVSDCGKRWTVFLISKLI